MPPTCAVSACKSRDRTHSKFYALHGFPLKDAERSFQWVQWLDKPGFIPTKHSTLCSLHFERACFRVNSRYPGDGRERNPRIRNFYLRDTAVPSLATPRPHPDEALSEETQGGAAEPVNVSH